MPHQWISSEQSAWRIGLEFSSLGTCNYKIMTSFKIQSTSNSNPHAAFHFSLSFFPLTAMNQICECTNVVHNTIFFYFYNCCAITKQGTYFAQQSNAQLFYLSSLMAGHLLSQPWNLSEKFLSYLNIQGLAPRCGDPSRIQFHYVPVSTGAVSSLRYSPTTDSEAEGAFVSPWGSTSIR